MKAFYRVRYEDMCSAYKRCRESSTRMERKEQIENSVDLFKKKANESIGEFHLQRKEEFGGRQKQLEQLKNKLKMIRQDFSHYECGDELKKTKRQIDNILLDEEFFWKQRSRADQLKEADKNTKFFYSQSSMRKTKNKIQEILDENGKNIIQGALDENEKNIIQGILDENGKWTKDNSDVERLFYEYFTYVFTTTNPTTSQMDAVLRDMLVKVNREMNN